MHTAYQQTKRRIEKPGGNTNQLQVERQLPVKRQVQVKRQVLEPQVLEPPEAQ